MGCLFLDHDLKNETQMLYPSSHSHFLHVALSPSLRGHRERRRRRREEAGNNKLSQLLAHAPLSP